MKSILFSVSLTLLSPLAFGSTHFLCTTTGVGSVQSYAQVFSRMDLVLQDDGTVTGKVIGEKDWATIGKDENGTLVKVEADPKTLPAVHIDAYIYHDIESIDFNLVEGKGVANTDEFLDCLGDRQGSLDIECHVVP